MKRPLIPEFEPEVIKAAADKHFSGDDEKIATTPLKSLEVHGVLLSSRYDKAHEYRIMALMVEGVSSNLRKYINNIWCDSKAAACYTVVLEPCTFNDARVIADQLDAACVEHGGGHNGISVSGSQGGHIEIDPNWAGDEYL